MMRAVAAGFLSLMSLIAIAAAGEAREPAWYAKLLAGKATSARQYLVEASIEVASKLGSDPRKSAGAFRVKIASAPGGRFLFWLGDNKRLEYVVVSDGQRTYGLLPEANKFYALDAIVSPQFADPEIAFASGGSEQDVDPMLAAGLMMPILTKLVPDNAAVVDLRLRGEWGTHEAERELPVLTVLSGTPETGNQRLTEVTFDPDTWNVTRLSWGKSVQRNDETRFTLVEADITRFEVDREIPAAHFAFDPGNTGRSESLPIPGMDPARWEGKPAPDWSRSQTVPVLLVFTGDNCAPCKRQSAALAQLRSEAPESVLRVVEAGASESALHSVYGIRFLPSLVFIDRQGVVRTFAAGARDAAYLRSLLEKSGR